MPLSDILWDFDRTILPLDSEDALLRSLSRQPCQKTGLAKALIARGLAWADQHGYLTRYFKRLYIYCLRGLPMDELDALAEELASMILRRDREAIRAIHDLGRRMIIVSCGTGDLIQRILAASGLLECFAHIEANWFTFWDGRIEGIDLPIESAEDKVRAVARLGIPLGNAVAIGDGFTDVPLLDRAGKAILVDPSGRHERFAIQRGYYFVRSLTDILPLLKAD